MTEVLFNSLLVALLAVPAVTLVSARWKKAASLPALLLLGALLAGAFAAVLALGRGHHLSVDLSWLAPFPFMLSIDRLSAYFLLLICVVGAPVVLFSTAYVGRHYKGPRRHWLWALLSLFLLSMVVVVTAATAFAFLFAWELMTLFSAALVVIDGDDGERRRNIFIYLLMMHAGAAAVVGAFLCSCRIRRASISPPCERGLCSCRRERALPSSCWDSSASEPRLALSLCICGFPKLIPSRPVRSRP